MYPNTGTMYRPVQLHSEQCNCKRISMRNTSEREYWLKRIKTRVKLEKD